MTKPSRFSFLRQAEDFLFPPGCFSCEGGRSRAFEGGICRSCWAALPAPAATRCGSCDLPLPPAAFEKVPAPVCGRCLAHPHPFDALRCAAPYSGVARDVVKAFKYSGADFLAPHLAARMLAACRDLPDYDAVIPVPATRKERRAHGFFPAGELAREFSRLSGKPMLGTAIRKVRETARQANLPLAARGDNVRGAFRAAAVGGSLLLVDDVATSGTTLAACARELRKKGARSVLAAAFGRALPEND
ncbi:MAG: double zinc ribbon domain-containing protein [Thermoanaerobaculia bacterium]